MATLEMLMFELNRQMKAISNARERIEIIAKDVERISKPDVLQVGTRVKLKENWNTPERHKQNSGWRAYLHFMHPDNPATIAEVEVYQQKIYYSLKFDDQKCYYTSGSGSYITDSIFRFAAKHIQVIR